MGWSSGSTIAIAVVTAVKKHVKDPKVRLKIYKPFLKEMTDSDWDCQDEAMDIDEVFDKLLKDENNQ